AQRSIAEQSSADLPVIILDPNQPVTPHSASLGSLGIPGRLRVDTARLALLVPSIGGGLVDTGSLVERCENGYTALAVGPMATSPPVVHAFNQDPPRSALAYPIAALAPKVVGMLSVATGKLAHPWLGSPSDPETLDFLLLFDSVHDRALVAWTLEHFQRRAAGLELRDDTVAIDPVSITEPLAPAASLTVAPYHAFYDATGPDLLSKQPSLSAASPAPATPPETGSPLVPHASTSQSLHLPRGTGKRVRFAADNASLRADGPRSASVVALTQRLDAERRATQSILEDIFASLEQHGRDLEDTPPPSPQSESQASSSPPASPSSPLPPPSSPSETAQPREPAPLFPPRQQQPEPEPEPLRLSELGPTPDTAAAAEATRVAVANLDSRAARLIYDIRALADAHTVTQQPPIATAPPLASAHGAT
ncbi:uncharacterized protein AMSG_09651, partial [Thecamonas trahens ATCC 50062]